MRGVKGLASGARILANRGVACERARLNQLKPMKEFKCKDAGHPCEWKVRAEKNEQIVREAREHGKRAHGLADPRDEEIMPLIHDVA